MGWHAKEAANLLEDHLFQAVATYQAIYEATPDGVFGKNTMLTHCTEWE